MNIVGTVTQCRRNMIKYFADIACKNKDRMLFYMKEIMHLAEMCFQEETIMKKKMALIMAAMMAMTMFTGCGSKTAETTAAATEAATEAAEVVTEAAEAEEAEEPAPEAEAVATVKEGVLTMGTNAAFPPYEYYEGEQIVGIDAEMAKAIADKLGMELEIVDMDFTAIITAVQSGKIDVGVAGMTVTEERLKNVNFSTSYSTGVQVVIVPEDSDIASIDDMEGKLIGTQEGTTGYIYCSDTPENGGFGEENVVAYTNGATAVQALVQGKVDCVVIDQQPALNFVEANPGLKILETEFVVEDYAIAVSKDNEPLLAAINTAIDELTADGTVQAILDKYIKAE